MFVKCQKHIEHILNRIYILPMEHILSMRCHTSLQFEGHYHQLILQELKMTQMTLASNDMSRYNKESKF